VAVGISLGYASHIAFRMSQRARYTRILVGSRNSRVSQEPVFLLQLLSLVILVVTLGGSSVYKISIEILPRLAHLYLARKTTPSPVVEGLIVYGIALLHVCRVGPHLTFAPMEATWAVAVVSLGLTSAKQLPKANLRPGPPFGFAHHPRKAHAA